MNPADNQEIDYRKDPAPTDWLRRRVARYDKFFDPDFKSEWDHFNDLVDELNELRCAPVCHTAASGCVCSLVQQLTSTENDLMPKGEFMAAIEAVGYNPEQALEQYRYYATKKIGDKYHEEFERLDRESRNAYNWQAELRSFEATKKLEEATFESMALEDKMDQEIEAAVSA